MDEGRESEQWLCEVAAKRGLMVDIHCDEETIKNLPYWVLTPLR